MVFSDKHNRNARQGQSLFAAARRPWLFFVVRRRAAGAFFVHTPAWGRRGAQERSVTLHHGRWASKVASGIGRTAAGRLGDARGHGREVAFTKSYHLLGASGLLRAGLLVQVRAMREALPTPMEAEDPAIPHEPHATRSLKDVLPWKERGV